MHNICNCYIFPNLLCHFSIPKRWLKITVALVISHKRNILSTIVTEIALPSHQWTLLYNKTGRSFNCVLLAAIESAGNYCGISKAAILILNRS